MNENGAWADRPFPLAEAVRYLQARAQNRCDHHLMWSLTDVAAVRVVTQAIDPEFVKDLEDVTE